MIAYILRVNPETSKKEVLVFDHEERFMDAGTQVVGGTIEDLEEPKEALSREVFEESGLVISKNDWNYLTETTYLRRDRPEINERTYFYFYSRHLPDQWDHRVQSNGDDHNMIFSFYWLDFLEAQKKLTGNFAEALTLIPHY